jgi:hypothetical protein
VGSFCKLLEKVVTERLHFDITTSDLLARLGLKARFLAWLFLASGLRYSRPGPAFWLHLALASHGLQALALYVFCLAGLQAMAHMSEQVLVDNFAVH